MGEIVVVDAGQSRAAGYDLEPEIEKESSKKRLYMIVGIDNHYLRAQP